MSDFKIDIAKFNVPPADARKQFQGLAHMAELAERHEGQFKHFPFVGLDLEILCVAFVRAIIVRVFLTLSLFSDRFAVFPHTSIALGIIRFFSRP